METTSMNDKEVLRTIVAGVSAATFNAVQVALSTDTNVVIWENGKIREVPPENFKSESSKAL